MAKTSKPTPSSGNIPAEPLIFFGNERIATGVCTTAPILTELIAAGYNIAAVVANYEPSQSRNARELEVADIAKQHGIPLLLPKKLRDIHDELAGYYATAGILVAYGQMVPESIIDLFPKGIINIHPSLLPKHRGPTPLESVILAGEHIAGVSVMQLAKAMDAGPVYAQAELALTGTETKQELADTLLDIGSSMLSKLLPDILTGDVVAAPQDDTAATYDSLITKDDGLLDFAHKSAARLEREVRAYLEWPKSRTTLGNTDVVITQAHVSKIGTRNSELGKPQPGTLYRNGKELGFYTINDIFIIDSLKPAGKQEMSAQAFLNGYSKDLPN